MCLSMDCTKGLTIYSNGFLPCRSGLLVWHYDGVRINHRTCKLPRQSRDIIVIHCDINRLTSSCESFLFLLKSICKTIDKTGALLMVLVLFVFVYGCLKTVVQLYHNLWLFLNSRSVLFNAKRWDTDFYQWDIIHINHTVSDIDMTSFS